MAGDLERDDKTELPTDRRRQEVRERGNVARSVDLSVAASVVASAAALSFFGGDLAVSMLDLLRKSLSAPAWSGIDPKMLSTHLWQLTWLTAVGLIPILGVMLVSAMAINFAQVGFLLTTEPLQPNFARLNPIAGLQRMLSLQGTVKIVASLLKLIVLVAIVVGFVMSQLPAFLAGIDLDTAGFCKQLGDGLVSLAFRLAIGLSVLAILDYGFQLWRFEQDIKMSKQEIRDEMRHMEGDPHIRQRRREAHRKLSQARQTSQTKTADVVVTNPTELAIAIKYDARKMDAPIVVAKGKDLMAARIRQIAAEHGIPIVEKKPLAQALFKTVKVGQAIPADLYEAVAEILAYVYRLAGKRRKSA